jgi:two-component system nitrate/nitrite response regulator NarL
MPEFEVVGEAGRHDAIDVVHRLKPDVILLDVNMPVMVAWKPCMLCARPKRAGFSMLTISKADEDLLGAITAGADGYLLRMLRQKNCARRSNW